MQAHGGKYIGPAVATPPNLSVLIDGRPIITGLTVPNKTSGTVVSQRSSASSPHAIVVQPPPVPSKYYPAPGTYWLDPPADGTADVIVSLPLTQPSQVEFRVEAFAPQPVVSSVTKLLQPGGAYTGEPGIVVPIPGLYVPQFSVQYSGGMMRIKAKVQMMCGCPITRQPASAPPTVEPYWPSNEFDVMTIVFPLATQKIPTFVPLDCVATDEFAGNLMLPPGTYACFLSAVQPATGNRGSASAHLVVQQ